MASFLRHGMCIFMFVLAAVDRVLILFFLCSVWRSGWPWGLSVMAISLVYFMLMDVVKCWVYKKWNFELTAKLVPTKARRTKLAKRQVRQVELQKFDATVRKVWRVANAVRFAMRFKEYKRLPEPKFQMPKSAHGH